MWRPDEGWWTTRETVCCQLPTPQWPEDWRTWGESKAHASAFWANRSYTARRVAEETSVIGGFKTTCTMFWKDHEPGHSSTMRLCKFKHFLLFHVKHTDGCMQSCAAVTWWLPSELAAHLLIFIHHFKRLWIPFFLHLMIGSIDYAYC